MNAIEFPGQNIIIAKDQPEYLPIPAFVGAVPIAPNPGGCPICGARGKLMPCDTPRNAYQCGSHSYDKDKQTIMQSENCKPPEAIAISFCMKLTESEKANVAETGLIWHTVLTFGQPLQPQQMTTERPERIPEK